MSASYPVLVDLPVLVTGGGSGIGAAIVAAFAGQGARVGFLEISEESARRSAARADARHTPGYRIVDLRDIAAAKAAITAPPAASDTAAMPPQIDLSDSKSLRVSFEFI